MNPAQLRAFRKRLDLSQLDLARALDMGPRQLQKYEHGQAPIPRTVELACAALALGLTRYPERE